MCEQALGVLRGVHLVIRERVVTAEAFYLCADERTFVQVLAFLFVLVDPQFWEHLRNLYGHQAREDGVACILCRCRKNAHVEFLLRFEQVANLLGNHAPLVIAEVVDDDEEHLLAFVEQREHAALEHIGRHHQLSFAYPVQVVLLHELRKADVGFLLLCRENLCHRTVS